MRRACRLVEITRSGDLRKREQHRPVQHVQLTHVNKGRKYPYRSSKRGGTPARRPSLHQLIQSALTRGG